MTKEQRKIYICEVCLAVSPEPKEHHGRPMIECDAGCVGDERSKPLRAPDGRVMTRAPRWWLEWQAKVKGQKGRE